MIRVIGSADFTTELNSFRDGSAVFSAPGDIFIGFKLPITAQYYQVSSVGSTGITASYWDGESFQSFAEIRDETVGFSKSGYIHWTTDKNFGWSVGDTVKADGSENITGLGSVKIYDLYWVKISFDTAPFTLDWISSFFCTEGNLAAEYPELDSTKRKTAYKAGKTTWDEQIFTASEQMINDLVDKGNINTPIVSDRLKLSCVHKTAEIIYNGLGFDYSEKGDKARGEYKDRISGFDSIDRNADGRDGPDDQGFKTTVIER